MADHGYSDQMARRIKCLQMGSFDCLIRGGIYDDEEARSILPYLDVRYSQEGYCVAYLVARNNSHETAWFFDDAPSPGSSAAKGVRRRTGNRGFVYLRHDDDVVVFWTSQRERGVDELRAIFQAAASELDSRYRVAISFAIGSWRTDLTEAHVSFQEAERAVAQGDQSRALFSGGEQLTEREQRVPGQEPELCAHEPVKSIQEYILEHFRDPSLALGTIAEQFELTETYLSQLFKEQTGSNYSVFLEQTRVKEAQHLLVSTTLPVSVVAGRVGYRINSTFYRAFRRMYGVSPSGYRTEIKERDRAQRVVAV